MTEKSMGHITDQVGRRLIRYNGLAFALGIVSLPALIHARNFAGWSLANPHGFSGAFPDFLAQYYPDQPFYLIYFVAGWWIYRLRDELPSLPQYWLWNLVLGVIAFAVSQNLSGKYFGRPGVAHGDLVFYELVVRPTPLVWIFGPASPGRAKRRCP